MQVQNQTRQISEPEVLIPLSESEMESIHGGDCNYIGSALSAVEGGLIGLGFGFLAGGPIGAGAGATIGSLAGAQAGCAIPNTRVIKGTPHPVPRRLYV